MKKIVYLNYFLSAFCILVMSSTGFSQAFFNDGEDLQDAVNAANPGDVFVVSNGSYNDFEASFEANGTVENPIIIKAETIGGVTLTGESHFVFEKSSHVIFEGFIFDGEGDDTLIKLVGSNNIRITRNVFELKTTESIKWVYIGGIYNDYTFQFQSHNNRIDHNVFQNKTTPGHYITIDGTSNEDESDSRQSQYDRIDHNHFKNNSPRAANEQESIRIGWSQMSMSSGYTIVEHNLFEDCDGDPEIVSVKSSDNIIRHNTFLRSYGTLSLRHGNRNRVEGNYFFGGDKANGTFETSTIYTGGIRIYGTDHVIVNNYMEGLKGTRWDAPIALTQGDAIDGSSSDFTKHFRAERVAIVYNTLVNNTYGIEIGFDNDGDYSKELKDITIANNIVTGSENDLVRYIDGNDQSGEITWSNNIMYPAGDANMVSGGSTFSEAEVSNTDPNLTNDGTIWRSTDASPTIESGSSLNITQDIDGQTRPEISTAGADHFSTESVRFDPLTSEDVGPNAYEDGETGADNLFISSISDFEAKAGTQIVSITSNVDWTIDNETDWISVSPTSGSGNVDIDIAVSENTSLVDRTGSITVEGGSITRSVSVVQKGSSAPGESTELTVEEVTASSEQAPNNVKENTLDKDLGTRWSAQGEGETITYDLGDEYQITLVKIAVYKGTERVTYFDIAVSTNGMDFTTVLADQESSRTTNELENYEFETEARYVRLIGGGNSGSENSKWNSITEVEIYGKESVSISNEDEITSPGEFKLLGNYPNPFNPTTTFQFQLPIRSDFQITIYNANGQLVQSINGKASAGTKEQSVDLTNQSSGVYFYRVRAFSNGISNLVGSGKMTLIK